MKEKEKVPYLFYEVSIIQISKAGQQSIINLDTKSQTY
jgi:hypothetical protein